MNKFNVFDELAFDTKQKLLSFCDYAPKTLSRYDSIVEMVKEAMDGTETVFSLSRIQKWLEYSSVYSDGTNRYLVDGHHTTVAFKMLRKENAINMNVATNLPPSTTNFYWSKKWYQFWRKAIKIVED